ncbi:unnamed protein product [Camellia sinensis]
MVQDALLEISLDGIFIVSLSFEVPNKNLSCTFICGCPGVPDSEKRKLPRVLLTEVMKNHISMFIFYLGTFIAKLND